MIRYIIEKYVSFAYGHGIVPVSDKNGNLMFTSKESAEEYISQNPSEFKDAVYEIKPIIF